MKTTQIFEAYDRSGNRTIDTLRLGFRYNKKTQSQPEPALDIEYAWLSFLCTSKQDD